MERQPSVSGNTAVIKPKPQETETEVNVVRFVVRPRNNVQWQPGTIDNENMGKKKSKICCIYNKPHTLDSSSSSDDDCCHDHGNAKNANRYDRYPKHQRRAMREEKKALGNEGNEPNSN